MGPAQSPVRTSRLASRALLLLGALLAHVLFMALPLPTAEAAESHGWHHVSVAPHVGCHGCSQMGLSGDRLGGHDCMLQSAPTCGWGTRGAPDADVWPAVAPDEQVPCPLLGHPPTPEAQALLQVFRN